jgi:integrase/recombinase XerC/integrase/recombinase XerD
VTEILSPVEISRLLSAIDVNGPSGARNHAIVVLFLDTGLRLSELVGLSVEDVRVGESWLKVYGKGGKERIVPFGARTTKVLNRYSSFYRPADGISDAFFVNEDGSSLTENAVKQVFKRLQVRAGLPRLHPHLLRHTFATSYLMAGGDVFSLQAILGHTTLEMTRRYVNLASSHVAIQQKRFSPMDRLAGGSGWRTPVPARDSAHRIASPARLASAGRRPRR